MLLIRIQIGSESGSRTRFFMTGFSTNVKLEFFFIESVKFVFLNPYKERSRSSKTWNFLIFSFLGGKNCACLDPDPDSRSGDRNESGSNPIQIRIQNTAYDKWLRLNFCGDALNRKFQHTWALLHFVHKLSHLTKFLIIYKLRKQDHNSPHKIKSKLVQIIETGGKWGSSSQRISNKISLLNNSKPILTPLFGNYSLLSQKRNKILWVKLFTLSEIEYNWV